MAVKSRSTSIWHGVHFAVRFLGLLGFFGGDPRLVHLGNPQRSMRSG